MDKIIVLVKQVPDMDNVRFDSEKGVIDRKSAGTEINPFDLNALETAVQVSEKTGADVHVISMGPPSAQDAIKEAIARGASSGVLLSDKKFGGSDVKATASVLAAAIRKAGPYSMVLAGVQTIDGDTGQVGPEVAQLLEIPHAGYAETLHDVDENKITVSTRIWEGLYKKTMSYPVLITVNKEISEPRLPSLKRKMQARKAEIPVWGLEDLKGFITENDTGHKGSATWVKKIIIPESSKRSGEIYRDDLSKALDAIMGMLKEGRILEVNTDGKQ